VVDDTTVATILGQQEPTASCRELVAAALAAGGHDNITVLVLSVPASLP
jgi:serine/threonine protein phosphatase PrpC